MSLQFNSEANGLDLYSDCRALCGIDETSDTTSYPVKAFTRNANKALDYATALIMRADGGWKWDDANNSDLPILVTDLQAGQSDYSLGVSYLKVNRVRIKDASGNFKVLPIRDSRELSDAVLDTTSGTPISCEIYGNSLFLNAPTSYASSGGLELEIQRPASYFAYTDTTKTPGFAPQFHPIISLLAAVPYCRINRKDLVGGLLEDIGSPPDLMNNEPGSGMVKELVDFYASRNEGKRISLTPKRDDYGQMGLTNGGSSFSGNSIPYGFG